MKFIGNHGILKIQNGRLCLYLLKPYQIWGKYGRFTYHMGPGGGGNVFKWCCINSTAASSTARTLVIVRKRRTVWRRGWLLNRPLYGQYENPLAEFNQEDFRGYENFLCINNELFEELVHHVGPHIQRITTPWRQPLSVGLRLAITLRYISSGDSYMSLQYSFRVANNTINCIVKETTMAIVREYMGEVMKCPTTLQE